MKRKPHRRHTPVRSFFGKPAHQLNPDDFHDLVRRYHGAKELLVSPLGRLLLRECLQRTKERLTFEDLEPFGQAFKELEIDALDLASELYEIAVLANTIGNVLAKLHGDEPIHCPEALMAYRVKEAAMAGLITHHWDEIELTDDPERSDFQVVKLRARLCSGLHISRESAKYYLSHSPAPVTPR
ncbi:MAG: hypothetical protein PHI73_01015 [Patescibacteria group bacterium]|nr:hypothetical protein [Patescibacteria group bacterium]